MSVFGDWEPLDAYDREPADPEQAARKYQRLRHDANPGVATWDDLTVHERADALAVVVLFLAWLRRSGAAL